MAYTAIYKSTPFPEILEHPVPLYTPTLFNPNEPNYPMTTPHPDVVIYPVAPDGSFYYFKGVASGEVTRLWPISDQGYFGENVCTAAYSLADQAITEAFGIEATTDAATLNGPAVPDSYNQSFIFNVTGVPKKKVRVLSHIGIHLGRYYVTSSTEKTVDPPSQPSSIVIRGKSDFNVNYKKGLASSGGTYSSESSYSPDYDPPPVSGGDYGGPVSGLTATGLQDASYTLDSTIRVDYLRDTISLDPFVCEYSLTGFSQHFDDIYCHLKTSYGPWGAYSFDGSASATIQIYALCLEYWEPSLYWPTSSDLDTSSAAFDFNDKMLDFNHLYDATGFVEIPANTTVTYSFSGSGTARTTLLDFKLVMECDTGGSIWVNFSDGGEHDGTKDTQRILFDEGKNVYPFWWRPCDPNNLTVTITPDKAIKIYAFCAQG